MLLYPLTRRSPDHALEKRQTALHEEEVGPITAFRDCEIFCDPVTSSRTLLRSPPILRLALSHMFHSSSEPPQRSLWAKNVVSTTLLT
jgi:hypothetical protein